VWIAGLNEPGVRLLVEGCRLGPDCKTPLVGCALDRPTATRGSARANASDEKRALRFIDATVSGKAGKRTTFDAFLARTSAGAGLTR
jgi:hypothetical protein